ncbi:MAG: exodeoxyribonuclease V subunit gamma [Janthinobacterium lividum]
MLSLFHSNRYEALSAALLSRLSRAGSLAGSTSDVFAPIEIVVPSAAIRRRLELDFADRFGICTNVRFCFLGDWLWQQIGRVMPVAERAPFAREALVWRILRAFSIDSGMRGISARLDAYLDASDERMRFELASRLARVFDQYIAYRPDWLLAWGAGQTISGASNSGRPGTAQHEDEAWQAALWRSMIDPSEQVSGGLAACDFLQRAQSNGFDLDTVGRAGWPARVSVFALPTLAPLSAAMLGELARWIDIDLYLVNPCREYWYDIVTPARAADLEARDLRDFHEIGNPLLAEWGREKQAQLQVLQSAGEGRAVVEDAYWSSNPLGGWLAAVQNAMLDLRLPDAAGGRQIEHDGDEDHDGRVGAHQATASAGNIRQSESLIEVHACHSLSRQVEVLHDRLLCWFSETPDAVPGDVMVAVPDLAAAAPLIEAVFGTASGSRRLPCRITGMSAAAANPVLRMLCQWLDLPTHPPGVAQLVEWLREGALGANYGIDAAALETLTTWLAQAGARVGLEPDTPRAGAASREGGEPFPQRHTVFDAVARLYLGFAMPATAGPLADWLPVGEMGASEAALLGKLSACLDDLHDLSLSFAVARPAAAWRLLLRGALERMFGQAEPGAAAVGLSAVEIADALADTRTAIDTLFTTIENSAADLPLSAVVVGRALNEHAETPTPGGVPSGAITVSALSSLRYLPFRVICVLGMDDGVLPGPSRADEFDLISALPRQGDRQRRDDERNLFLDLLLAAREMFFVAYTGRSVRDNSALPPAAVVDELLDHLARAAAHADSDAGASTADADVDSAEEDADVPSHAAVSLFADQVTTAQPAPATVSRARKHFLFEHPLQSFASVYLDAAGPLYTYDAQRARIAAALAGGRSGAATPFFDAPLPAETTRVVSLEDLRRFWAHPARVLLRGRLGLSLPEEAVQLVELEPFELDWGARDAITDRVLPMLLAASPPANDHEDRAARRQRATAIAQAVPQAPIGATGALRVVRQTAALATFADTVVALLNEQGAVECPFALTIAPHWPEALASEAWRNAFAGSMAALAVTPAAISETLVIEGSLHDLTPFGQILRRPSKPGPRDKLDAWLMHLVFCAMPATALPTGMRRRTLWIGNEQTFEFREVDDAATQLATWLALYLVGRRMPLPFFPKSSMARICESRAAAERAFSGSPFGPGEADDSWWLLVYAGSPMALDESFEQLAQLLLTPLHEHLIDPAELSTQPQPPMTGGIKQ